MNLISKILVSIFGTLALMFLLYLSFFLQDGSQVEKISYPKNTIASATGYYSLSGTTLLASLEKNDESLFGTERLGSMDIVLSTSDTYTVSESGTGVSLSLTATGKYVFQLYDPSKNYTIEVPGYRIHNIGPSLVYVNYDDVKKNFIYVVHGGVQVQLMDEKNTEEITQVYLYPHTYISFNALNNKYFKNSDFLRIKSVFELQYLDDPLFDDGSVNTEVLRHLVYGNERDLPILKSMFSYLHERYADFFEDYSYLRNIDTWQLPGAERIQKYFSFFMNDAKREVYYKNAVLAGYLDILQHPSVEAQTYEQVQSYMQELQSISPQAYKEMKDLLSSLYVISGNTQGMSDVAVKSRISKLYAQVFGIKSYHEDLAFFLLNTMYYGYDFQGETDFFSPFSQFLRQYMVEEGMIDSDGQFVRQDFSASGVYDYFSNYLQELLIANISFNSEDITALLYVLSRYIILDEQLYTGEDEKRKITGIQVHLDILKKIQSEMLSFYFLSARGENDILQREFGNTLASVELDSLEKSVNQLIQFYDKNKQLISGSSKERDIGYMRSYSELSGSFREYFLALRDYEKYEVEYNSVKRQLLDQAVVDVDTETTISEESFLEYMSQFQGVVLTNVDLTIEEDSYHAENVLIAGRRFSFDLLPGKRNEIRNIQIDGEDSRVSYALDDEEEALADLFAQAKQEERDRYDFRNFFLNTFIYKGGDTTREIVQDELPEDQEDKVIIAIKNDKLLGTRGEFASIKNLLQIEYDDLDVLIKEGGYQIHIEDAFLELSPESDSSGKNIAASFSADYTLAGEDHYFSNIRLKLYENYEITGKNFEYFGGRDLTMIGTLDIRDFSRSMQSFANTMLDVFQTYTSIKTIFSETGMNVKYFLSTGKSDIKFEYKGKIISILLHQGMIEKLSYAGKNYVQNPAALVTISQLFRQMLEDVLNQ